MLVAALTSLFVCQCLGIEKHKISTTSFGSVENGHEAKIYTLKNQNGIQAMITDYGATLVSLVAPDRGGVFADLLHGYDSVEGYAGPKNPYFGGSIGRFGNRIAHGKFSLDGVEYRLATNNTPGDIPCSLHGGVDGFHRRFWSAIPKPDENAITFTYVSVEGEEGFPGTLKTTVTYKLTDENELIWTAEATVDKPTIINIVHHPYWNLSGDPTTTINDHILMLPCDSYLSTDAGLIPTGELAAVQNTPMDFRKPTTIGSRVNAKFEALEFGNGYDHCWILKEPNLEGVALAARLKDPNSGRVMEIWSNQPAVQFYGGNFLDPLGFQGEFVSGKDGIAYGSRTALCLETEHYPDAPNQPNFPSTVLRPGEKYKHKMIYRFSIE